MRPTYTIGVPSCMREEGERNYFLLLVDNPQAYGSLWTSSTMNIDYFLLVDSSYGALMDNIVDALIVVRDSHCRTRDLKVVFDLRLV
jgi:hypothetical protein